MGVAVFVVGHRGMLGTAVRRYLDELGHRVLTTDLRFTGGATDPLIEQVERSDAEVIVNCAGVLSSNAATEAEMLVSNALLPLQLGARLGEGRLFIHASTDGVFSGERGRYSVDDRPDATDTYGLSKHLGELVIHLAHTVVIRTSIVGAGGGLLRWLLEQRSDVPGYTDHFWNGVTTVEWARVCAEMIERRRSQAPGIVHLTSRQPISKFELLDAAARIFGSPVRVLPVTSGRPVNRVLVPTIERGRITQQLAALRRWERGGP
ncbi:MAG: sugar nucleotide-binding protein [Chloroflexi bacterium]|nr:sugar nucleotide-binding protein [Chloroflexota bacterium]